jgi:hypothetical protein
VGRVAELGSLDVKRVLVTGLCVGVAYLLLLGLLLAFSIPPGIDDFPFRGLYPDSTRFRVGLWFGTHVAQPMLAIFTPLAWLLHSLDGDLGIWFWFVAIPYVLLLGIGISFLCHRVSALVRARQS